MLKKLFLIILNILGILYYFYLKNHIGLTLDKLDFILEKNGKNNYCKKTSLNKIDKSICQYERYNQFVVLYYDSLPMNLIKPLLLKFGKNMEYHKLIQKGMEDSGPFMNSIFTGVWANKYEGKVTKVDNIFTQLINSGYDINGIGSRYPFEELIGKSYFKNYKRENGSIICEEMVNFENYEKILYPNIINSLIKNEDDKIKNLEKFYYKFKKINLENKDKIDKCLKANYINNKNNYFLYKVKLDEVGHKYSGQSGIFIAYSASILANLDYFFNFLKEENSELLVSIISDHGVNEKIWMMEFFNHGIHKDGNEGFLTMFSNKFNYTKNILSNNIFKKFDQISFNDQNNTFNSEDNRNFTMLSTQFSNYFLSFIKGTDSLINNLNTNLIRQDIDKNISTLISLRIKEIQWLNLIKNPNFKSKFYELFEKNLIITDQKSKINSENINLYKKSIKELLLEAEIYMESLNTPLKIKSIILMIFGLLIFVFRFLYINYKNKQNNNTKIIFWMLSIFILFILKNKVYTEAFVYHYVIFSVVLIAFNIKNVKFYFINLLLVFGLILYESLIKNKFDYYLVFYNIPALNIISMIIMLYYTKKYFKFIEKIEEYYLINKRINCKIMKLLEIIMTIFVFSYEIILMFHYNIKQNEIMIYISRMFILFVVIRLILSFNIKINSTDERIYLFIKIIFWLCINYHRIAYFCFIFPVYFYYNKNEKIIETIGSLKYFGIIFFNFLGLFIFFILRGGFDCEISTRAAFRNWNYSIEDSPTMTGIIFALHKNLIFFIIPFIYCSLYIKSSSNKIFNSIKNKSITQRLITYFNNKHILTINCWYGLIVSIYLLSFENALNQRASYMFYISAFITNIIYYLEFFTFYLYLEIKLWKFKKE